ncbi:hypothetical protein CDV36_016429, partial [Fusarium kuroshium]
MKSTSTTDNSISPNPPSKVKDVVARDTKRTQSVSLHNVRDKRVGQTSERDR